MADSETFVLSADSASAQAALEAVNVRLKSLRAEWTKTAKDAKMSAEEFSQAEQKFLNQAKQLFTQREVTKKQLSEISTQMTTVTQTVSRTGGAWDKLGKSVGSLSYAADDFLTVWGQNGSVTMGLHAAANNISFMLAQFAPWLVIVPSLVVAGIKFATSTDKSTTSLKEKSKALKEAEKAAKEYQSSLDDISKSYARIVMGSDAATEAERRRDATNALRKMRQQGLQMGDEIERIRRDPNLTDFQKHARMHNLNLERKKLGEQFQALQEQEVQIRAEFDKKQAAGKLEGAVSGIEPGLQGAAKAMAAAGIDAETIAARLAPHISRVAPDADIQAVLAMADKFAASGARAANAAEVHAKPAMTPEEMQLDEAKREQTKLKIQKANAVVAAGGNPLDKETLKQFSLNEAKLSALIMALEDIVKQQKDNQDPLQKAAEALERLARQAGIPFANGNN